MTSESQDLQWELVAEGWHFPTSLALSDDGVLYLAESGLPFAGAPPGGRVWRIEASGDRTLLADDLRAPANGLTLHRDALYVSEGGHPGRITRLGLDGTRTTVLDDLPGPENYHTNMAVVGPDDKLYFSQGSLTNLGIVGLDAYAIGWLGGCRTATTSPVTWSPWPAPTSRPPTQRAPTRKRRPRWAASAPSAHRPSQDSGCRPGCPRPRP